MPSFVIDEDAPVLVDFTPGPGIREVAFSADDAAKKAAQALDGAMNTIYHMARRVSAATQALAAPPSEVEVAFGIKLDAEAGALIAKAGVEASISVKLTWRSG